MADQRGSWGSWFEFLFSALGSMVGLGNIWRFPYVCYRSGGGAFLIPFFISMIVCGCPLIFLETLYCQYSNLGPGRVWVVCPLFKGIGFGMMTLTFVVSIYYTMIMGWTLHYTAMSFSSSLPWTECPRELELLGKCGPLHNMSFMDNNASTINTTQWTSTTTPTTTTSTAAAAAATSNTTIAMVLNATGLTNGGKFVSKEEYYWFVNVLEISRGIDELGGVRWQLLLCLLAAWVVVFLCLIKGIKSMGKVVYVAATIPYIILTCLLIRGCLLPGSGMGLYFYMVPDWSKLAHFDVWRSAATQVFFSIGIGFGLISTLASYNKFNNNCYRDALILPVLDCVTSVYAGLVIFAYLGYMSHSSGISIDKVASEGPGLVFIAYPAALSTLPLPQLWSVLFFLMLFSVGLDSQFMHVQGVTTALADCFPSLLMNRRTSLTAVVCVISFILGLPLTTQGGSYILNLMDWYIASFSVMLIAFIEVMVLAWIYGTERLYCDIEAMIGFRPNLIWKVAWKFFSPVFILVLWVSGLIDFQTIGSTYAGYPDWADAIGLMIAVLPILPIPVKMVWSLCRSQGSLKQRVNKSIHPSPHWRPAIDTDVDEAEMQQLKDDHDIVA